MPQNRITTIIGFRVAEQWTESFGWSPQTSIADVSPFAPALMFILRQCFQRHAIERNGTAMYLNSINKRTIFILCTFVKVENQLMPFILCILLEALK